MIESLSFPSQAIVRVHLFSLALIVSALAPGCSDPSNRAVEETSQYSYDEIMAQAAAEEAASEAEREP